MALTFGDFLSIFTTNDASGGRAIKATFDTGIDDVQNYLTKNDPAGGRAIKIVNVGAPLGPQFWTEAYNAGTQATSSWTAAGAATNINAAIIPKGTGAIVAAIPDGTATGGNARGIYAVDLQLSRSAATQVASGDWSVIGGGQTNTASGTAAIVGGGSNNLSQVYKGYVGGGGTNTANGFGSVGGGFTNITNSNVALGTVSVTLTAGSSTIPGGAISATASPGGALITGSGIAENTFITNYAPPNLSMSNNATASGATTLSFWSVGGTVAGGRSNSATGLYAAITGGQGNTASSNHTFVGGGQSNTVSGSSIASWSLIGGGFGNGVSGNYDVIVGGRSNSISGTNNGNHRFIGGGSSNSMGEQCLYSIIVGGETNSIFGRNSFIGGGATNAMTEGAYSVITGGQSNTMSGSGTHKTISGGLSNSVSGAVAVVSGGSTNTASASYSTITGGFQGTASLYGQQVHASGRFTANGDAQAHELIWRRAITGTAQTELFLDGASTAAILPGTNSVWNGIIDVTAICTVTGDGTTVVSHVAATSYKVTIKRIGTTTSLVGGVQEIGITNADASMSTAAFAIDNNDTNESLRVQFTPPATAGSTTVIRAIATFRGQQIQY